MIFPCQNPSFATCQLNLSAAVSWPASRLSLAPFPLPRPPLGACPLPPCCYRPCRLQRRPLPTHESLPRRTVRRASPVSSSHRTKLLCWSHRNQWPYSRVWREGSRSLSRPRVGVAQSSSTSWSFCREQGINCTSLCAQRCHTVSSAAWNHVPHHARDRI